jgi:integrase
VAIREIGDGKFKIDLRIGGRKGPRMRKTVENATPEAVKEIVRDLRQQARAMSAVVTGPTLRDGFVHAYAVRWRGKRGERSVNQDYGVLTRHIPEHTPLSQIGSKEIVGAIDAMRKAGAKDQTINHKTLDPARDLQGGDEGDAADGGTSMPTIPLLKPTRRLVRKPLSHEQEAEFLAYFVKRHSDPKRHPREGDKWRLMIDLDMFLADTGCRLGEALRCVERDINMREGTRGRVGEQGRRAAHAADDAARTGDDRAPHGGPLELAQARRAAVHRQGEEHDPASLQGGARRARVRAGDGAALPAPHDGTRLIERGEDVRVVKEFMGHKRIETTMGYAHVKRAQIAAATAKLAGAPEVSLPDPEPVKK